MRSTLVEGSDTVQIQSVGVTFKALKHAFPQACEESESW